MNNIDRIERVHSVKHWVIGVLWGIYDKIFEWLCKIHNIDPFIACGMVCVIYRPWGIQWYVHSACLSHALSIHLWILYTMMYMVKINVIILVISMFPETWCVNYWVGVSIDIGRWSPIYMDRSIWDGMWNWFGQLKEWLYGLFFKRI